ncbi:flagellar assembly protein FliH [Rheinheimera riviphila]|uniref:Flagellar assembly protein FliH n=1 Tax=Rheinheimera riviphila TaxID=1834037 RepID=A0A437R3H5_9GAMM|nr:flagellar assembly protein FliH [Rheinheimera riviphila]RVU41328.1 flagellar assembly protein FliH [Rheinheimera riviphila]
MTTNMFQQNRPFKPDPGVMDILNDWDKPPRISDDEPAAKTAPAQKAAPTESTMPVVSPASLYKTNALYKKRPEPGERLSAKNEEELVIKPLTADDIEQIRQAAFDEGSSQGKEEGFGQGYSEGREQGYQDGLLQGQAEGKKQGLSEGEQLIRDQLAQLQFLMNQLQQPLQKVDAEVEQSLLHLALQMAQAVIGVEVKTNPQCILNTLREAVDALPYQADKLIIKLHPADVAVIQQHYSPEDIAERLWQIRSEPALERGDCRVESTESSVDRTLKTRLQSSLEHFLQEPAIKPEQAAED